ncbi:hypothetical protein ASG31_11265 [Chryseobacterium sp. Leaf404]|uniref:hypothetical protein n=1 Tax=unclassified Chryseobacterium TaxID=2593645 RepID=UPI0006F9372D|nr:MULTISPECIES: hypothetical protein [unclassified Chryseobacterium]KQT16940.1 hypothetical protein ASG31_11265 [Chryseobacterium sp. Leaf404]
MKNSLILGIFMNAILHGQVGINTTAPVTTLQIDKNTTSTTATVEGLMIPRLSGNDIFGMPVVAGASMESNLVYATSPASLANQVGVGVNLKSKGYYYWDGSVWVTIGSSTTFNNLLAFVKPMNMLLNDVDTYAYSSTAFTVPSAPKLKLFDCSYAAPVDFIIENNPLSGTPNFFVIWDNANSKINVPQQLLGNVMTINVSLKYAETTSNSDASRFVAYTGNAVYNSSLGTVSGGTKIKDLMFKKTKTSGFTTVRDELVLSPIIITQDIINYGIKLYLGSGDSSNLSYYEPVLTIDYGVVNTTL